MYELQAPLSFIFTLFFLHFLSSLYWQCMLLHVIFGILHHSFLIICVLGRLPFPSCRQKLSFTICRILYPRKHKCRCMRQRHLNKERNFFGGESVLCIGKSSLPHLLYIQYTRFSGIRKFLSEFFGGSKKAPDGAFFKYGNSFLLYSFLCIPVHMPWH